MIVASHPLMSHRKHLVYLIAYCALMGIQPIDANAESPNSDFKTTIVQVFTDSIRYYYLQPEEEK